MELDRLAFYKYRFKRLNAKTVKRRRPVQHDRMFADDLFQDIPYFRALFFNHALGRLDGRRHAV